MNLIWCSKPCAYQSEGVCTLERVTAPTASTEQGCGYYVPAKKATETGERQTSSFSGN